MVLDYFLPDRKFSIQDLEVLTGFVEGKGAYEMEELLNYSKLDLEAKVIINISYEEFAERGFEYIEEIVGLEIIQWIKDNTGDIELEKKRAAQVAKKDIHQRRIPTQANIKELLANDWLVMIDVNSRKLNKKSGFSGHRVLIYGADERGVVLHDPGPPPSPSRKVTWQALEDAWADPNEDSKMLIAVRKLQES
jgi:hypothetical protein